MVKKIQGLPKSVRYIILWSVMGIVGIGLFMWWGKGLVITLQSVKTPEVEKILPASVAEKVREISHIEFFDDEDFEITKELLEELERELGLDLELEIEQQQ